MNIFMYPYKKFDNSMGFLNTILLEDRNTWTTLNIYEVTEVRGISLL